MQSEAEFGTDQNSIFSPKFCGRGALKGVFYKNLHIMFKDKVNEYAIKIRLLLKSLTLYEMML